MEANVCRLLVKHSTIWHDVKIRASAGLSLLKSLSQQSLRGLREGGSLSWLFSVQRCEHLGLEVGGRWSGAKGTGEASRQTGLEARKQKCLENADNHRERARSGFLLSIPWSIYRQVRPKRANGQLSGWTYFGTWVENLAQRPWLASYTAQRTTV